MKTHVEKMSALSLSIILMKTHELNCYLHYVDEKKGERRLTETVNYEVPSTDNLRAAGVEGKAGSGWKYSADSGSVIQSFGGGASIKINVGTKFLSCKWPSLVARYEALGNISEEASNVQSARVYDENG